MIKDITEKRLERYPDVAADIIDGIMYDGNLVVVAEDLVRLPANVFLNDNRQNVYERERDILFLNKKDGCRYAFYGIENQTEADNTMPLRIMEYDGAVYREQVKEYQNENNKNRHSAYVRTIHKEQKLIPVVTIILYYGKEWDGPRSIKDMFNLEGREKLLPYLSDYKINVIELGKKTGLHKKFRSDFRYVVQYMEARGNRVALNDFFMQSSKDMRHKEECIDVLRSIMTEHQTEKLEEMFVQEELTERKDEENMTIVQQIYHRGELQGENKATENIVRNMLARNMSIEDICAITACDEVFVNRIKNE